MYLGFKLTLYIGFLFSSIVDIVHTHSEHIGKRVSSKLSISPNTILYIRLSCSLSIANHSDVLRLLLN